MKSYYLAIDIGASSGRHILGSLEDGKISLEEIYRFDNGMEKRGDCLCWNTEALFDHILEGMKRCREAGKIPVSLGIDTWGVDFVLLDQEEHIIGEAVGYRDHRTDSMQQEAEQLVSARELYERTGIQSQSYNTLYQLMAVKKTHPDHLKKARVLLFTPDYYHYLLTGVKNQEYTIATTSQLVNAHTRSWDYELIDRLGFPRKLFCKLQAPGTPIGRLKPDIAKQVGFDCLVVAPASHDTASAVAALPSKDKDNLYISSGTWSLMGIEAAEPNCTEKARLAGFTNEGGYRNTCRFLKNIMGLWMIQSVRKEIGNGVSYAEICESASREVIASIVDCNDSSFLSPDSMTGAVRQFCLRTGQQVPQTLPEYAAVIYSSLAKSYAEALNQIEELSGRHYSRIHIIGGGSRADYLNRLTGKHTGREIQAGPEEATAIGNLLVQMLYHREFASLAAARLCI